MQPPLLLPRVEARAVGGAEDDMASYRLPDELVGSHGSCRRAFLIIDDARHSRRPRLLEQVGVFLPRESCSRYIRDRQALFALASGDGQHDCLLCCTVEA